MPAAPPPTTPTVGQSLALRCDDGPRDVLLMRGPDGVTTARMALDGQPHVLRRVTLPRLPADLLLFEEAGTGWRWSVNQRSSVLSRHGPHGTARIVARCRAEEGVQMP